MPQFNFISSYSLSPLFLSHSLSLSLANKLTHARTLFSLPFWFPLIHSLTLLSIVFPSRSLSWLRTHLSFLQTHTHTRTHTPRSSLSLSSIKRHLVISLNCFHESVESKFVGKKSGTILNQNWIELSFLVRVEIFLNEIHPMTIEPSTLAYRYKISNQS